LNIRESGEESVRIVVQKGFAEAIVRERERKGEKDKKLRKICKLLAFGRRNIGEVDIEESEEQRMWIYRVAISC